MRINRSAARRLRSGGMDDHTDFAGFGPAAFAWLDDLAADNSRAFFAASRPLYERELRDPFTAMLQECTAWTGGRPRVYRQLRDLRFAANRERPYWPSIAGEIVSRPGTAAAFVADLGPDGLTAIAGYRRPFTRDQLRRYRAAVVDDPVAGEALAAIVAALHADGAELAGATLRTGPRGYPRDHACADLLRHTALSAGLTLPPTVRRRRRGGGQSINRTDALAHLASGWARLEPLVRWLDEHAGPAEAPAPAAIAA